MKLKIKFFVLGITLVSCGRLKALFNDEKDNNDKNGNADADATTCQTLEKRLEAFRKLQEKTPSIETDAPSNSKSTIATNHQENGVQEGESHIVTANEVISFAYGRLRVLDRNTFEIKQSIDLELGSFGTLHQFEKNIAVIQYGNQETSSTITLFEENRDGLLTKTVEKKISGAVSRTRSVGHILIIESNIYVGNQNAKLADLAGNDCKNIVIDDPSEVSSNLIDLRSFDLKTNLQELSRKQYFGWSYGLYATPKSIYLSVQRNSLPLNEEAFVPIHTATRIARFVHTNDGIKFSGSIPSKCYAYSPWQFHEAADHLFVVQSSCWDKDSKRSFNQIESYKLEDSQLIPVSKSEKFAESESVFSARFMENNAYIVTFLRTDPLFIFDLSNPADMRLKGQLTVPGFSNYLHTLSTNRLLGVGVSENLTAEMSLFDTSDFNKPKLLSKVEFVNDKNIAFDHRDFFYEPESGYVAAKFQFRENTAGAPYRDRMSIARLSGDSLAKVGQVSHVDLSAKDAAKQWCSMHDFLKFMQIDGKYYSISTFGLVRHVFESEISSQTLVQFPMNDISDKVTCGFCGTR